MVKVQNRRLRDFVFIVIIAAFCVYAFALGLNSWYRYSAENLLSDIRSLKIGESTQADVNRIGERYNAKKSTLYATPCGSADSIYEVAILNQSLFKIEAALPWLRRIGLRPWQVEGTFFFNGGRICSVVYLVRQWSGDGSLEVEAYTTLTPSEEDLSLAIGDKQNHRYGIRRRFARNSIQILEVALAPSATALEREHSLQYDLSCLTSFRGCLRICKLMPLVWSDYVERLRSEGQDISDVKKCLP